MAKRKHHHPSRKFTVMDLLKGNFLNKEEVKQHYKYILFCFTLLMIMIFTNDLVQVSERLYPEQIDKDKTGVRTQ